MLHDWRVAVKRIRTLAGGEDAVRRFEREVRTLSGLNHPHIMGVTDMGTDDEGLYYVMEFVEGQSLRQWLAAPWGHIQGSGIAAWDDSLIGRYL